MSEKGPIGKAIREPRKALSIVLHKFLAPVGHYDYRRFIVLTRDRTGSNMLIQTLKSHPNVDADYEIFAKLYGGAEQSILDKAFGKQPFYIKAKGFKIFYYHPQDNDSGVIWDMLEPMEDLYVIHLKRRNILRTLISSRIAYATGVYGVRSAKEEAEFRKKVNAIAYSAEQLQGDFEQTRKWEKEGEERFKNHPMISIDYEDMVSHRDQTFHSITNFLGVNNRKPKTDFMKQGTKRLRDMLKNYDQLKDEFRGSEWEVFFED